MNLEKLKGHIPDKVLTDINSIKTKFEINTSLRLAHFLAQAGHESGGFRLTQENLNYGAKGLVGLFGKYFTATSAKDYERKPEKIANVIYANRMGNGTTASGDGWRFRGRGYIQLTGRDNYTAFGKSIGIDIPANPDVVATEYALSSAAWFWWKNGLNKLADLGPTTEVVTKITKRVNGGTIGLADRISHFNEYYNLVK